MRFQGLQHRPAGFRGLKSTLRKPVFSPAGRFWPVLGLIALVMVLAALPGQAQAQTSDSPTISSPSVSGANATISIFSFHYLASASSNYIEVKVCTVTDTGALDETDCSTSSQLVESSSAFNYDLNQNTNWPQGGGGSRRIRARTYTTTSTTAYYSPYSGEILWTAADFNCNEHNSPPIHLGTLGLADGATLNWSGNMETRYYEAPCDSPGSNYRGAVFFRFTLGEDGAGAVKIEAPRNQSTMIADLYVRSGTAYSGTVLWRDRYNYSRDDALAAGLLAAGDYTLELRNATQDRTTANPPAAGGNYSLTITRLQPRLSSSYTTPSGVHTTWDVGNSVHSNRYGNDHNSIVLPVNLDYKKDSDASWTSAATNLSPPNLGRTVTSDITSLDFGETYLVRAGYTNASHYTISEDLTTEAYIRLSASPFRVEAVKDLIDEALTKYRVRVAWQTPPIVTGDDLTYRYSTRLDKGAAVQNPEGEAEVLEAVFDYSPPPGQNILEIEVNNTFTCAATPPAECELTYAGEDFAIPGDESWSTTWSAPGLVRFDVGARGVGNQGVSRDPDPAVTEAIDLVLENVMVPEESRQPEALAVVLGGLLAIGVGVTVGVMARGAAVNRVILGAGITFTLLGGVVSVLFGFPDELIAIMAALAMILAAAFLLRRFAFE